MTPRGNLSPHTKAKFLSMRKDRLKALSERKSESEIGDVTEIRPKVHSKTLKIKVTTKSRGDFLCEMEEQNAREVKKKIAKPLPMSVISNLKPKYPPPEKVDTPKKSDSADKQPKGTFVKFLGMKPAVSFDLFLTFLEGKTPRNIKLKF